MEVRLTVLKEYLSCLLIEGRVDDARSKVPDMEDEDFDFLVTNQPAGSNNKYLIWSCIQAEKLLENDPDRQALSLVVQAIRLFDGNQQRLKKRDINQYDSITEVEEAVAEVGKSKGQKTREVKADTDVIYQDDRFMIVRPHTTEASCKYGTGTKWCIAATATHNYFNSYSTSNNKFYFVIDKKAAANTPDSKFALAIMGSGEDRIQVYNASDKLVSLATVAKHVGAKWSQMWDLIQSHVKTNSTTREVDDARKATEEHVKALLSGDNVSTQALHKITTDGKLTMDVVKALLNKAASYNGPADYNDPRTSIVSGLSNRADQMPGEAAMMLYKYILSTKPNDDAQTPRYWYGLYQLDRIIDNARFSEKEFAELVAGADENTLMHVMMNPNTPASVKDAIAKQASGFKKEPKHAIYYELAKSGQITKAQLEDAVKTDSYFITRLLGNAEHINIPAELIKVIPVTSLRDLMMLMQMPNFPPDYVTDVVNRIWSKTKAEDSYELYDLLKTAPIDTRTIDSLWKDKNAAFRTALLQNPAIGPEVTSKFVLSKNHAYRFAVAHNTATSVDDLNLLATDESVSTRAAVGANPRTSPDTLTKLAGDEAVDVRASVASNASTPRPTLEALKKDSETIVRRSARKTLKSLETVESYMRMSTSMASLLCEELEDDEMQDIMVPGWRQVPHSFMSETEFVAVFLLQNNGHATREDVEAAYKQWAPQGNIVTYRGSRSRYGGRRRVESPPKPIWTILKQQERHGNKPSRATSVAGKGLWWSPAGMTAGSLYRLTPAGASVAMNVLSRLRAIPGRTWERGTEVPVKRSPPARELGPKRPDDPVGPARGPSVPKTTYKIYGRFKGHPASTRLKGQAYVAPADTQFSAGEQAHITPEDGKLKVKKADGEHTQTWEPTDG